MFIACCIPFLSRWKTAVHTGWFVLPLPLLLCGYFISLLPNASSAPRFVSIPWIPSLGINIDLYADGLALLFALLITGIGSLVTFYSIYYLKKTEELGHFYTYLAIFMTAMLGVVLSDNIFILYTFWELTSLSSFLLIGFWNKRKGAQYGAQKSLFITVAGGLSLFASFLIIFSVTGTSSIRSIILQSDMLLNSPLFPAILLLMLLGAFTKSAQYPFHTWLPDAMEAPTPVSAYLHSATMVKAGIYLVARFLIIFASSDLFFLMVTGVGLATLCWGAFLALRQTDLKAILAYSTISQLGMVMAMLGFGTNTAVFAAVFHLFNHATFKGCLFMVAGIIDHKTGTRDIRKLRGLLTFMPITATLAFFAAFSMAGIPMPLLNGFLSKEMFFKAATQIGEGSLREAVAPFIPVAAVLGSLFTFAYSMLLVFSPFTGKVVNTREQTPQEPGVGMLISPALLALFIVGIGLFPNVLGAIVLVPAAESILGGTTSSDISFWHGFFNVPFLLSCLVVIVGTILYMTRHRWNSIYHILPGKLSFDTLYQFILTAIGKTAKTTNRIMMTESLTDYFRIVIVVFVGLAGYTLIRSLDLSFVTSHLASGEFYEYAIMAIVALSALACVFIHHRIALILTVGVTGYCVSLLFVVLRAPDLALTQLVIETVTVALFLLCFYHLPEIGKIKQRAISKGLQIILSVSVGVIVAVIGIASYSDSGQFEKISTYFLKTSYALGGGDNVVNVILVDMRGLDTLLEITVLGLAALGIYTMIHVRDRERLK